MVAWFGRRRCSLPEGVFVCVCCLVLLRLWLGSFRGASCGAAKACRLAWDPCTMPCKGAPQKKNSSKCPNIASQFFEAHLPLRTNPQTTHLMTMDFCPGGSVVWAVSKFVRFNRWGSWWMIVKFLEFWSFKSIWNPPSPMTKAKRHLFVRKKNLKEKDLRQRGRGPTNRFYMLLYITTVDSLK